MIAAFAFFFFVEALSRTIVLNIERPNEGSPSLYVVRLLATLAIVISILRK